MTRGECQPSSHNHRPGPCRVRKPATAPISWARNSPSCIRVSSRAGDSLADLYAAIHQRTRHRDGCVVSVAGYAARSFALGVLQALVRHGLTFGFDDLSTGSVAYTSERPSAWCCHAGDDSAVLRSLQPVMSIAGPGFGPRGLRASSNYLTPRKGAMSPETWTAVALVVTNWVMIGPYSCRSSLRLHWCQSALPNSSAGRHCGPAHGPSCVLALGRHYRTGIGPVVGEPLGHSRSRHKPGRSSRHIDPVISGGDLLAAVALTRSSERRKEALASGLHWAPVPVLSFMAFRGGSRSFAAGRVWPVCRAGHRTEQDPALQVRLLGAIGRRRGIRTGYELRPRPGDDTDQDCIGKRGQKSCLWSPVSVAL